MNQGVPVNNQSEFRVVWVTFMHTTMCSTIYCFTTVH